jgi:hypothetical protein
MASTGWNDSDFVVDQHGGDQAGAVLEAGGKQMQVDQPVRADRDTSTSKPCSQARRPIEHASMFGRERDDLAPPDRKASGSAFERPVRGLGRAGCEEELAPSVIAQGAKHLVTRNLDRRRRFAADPMRGMRVTEALLSHGCIAAAASAASGVVAW